MTQTQISGARTLAGAILKAWRANDLEQLQRNLTDALDLATATVEDSGEEERLEMLGTIARAMRLLLRSDRHQEAALYLPLLRHLACPPVRVLDHVWHC